MKYEIREADEVSPERLCRTNDDGSISFIPIDENNPDYQEYLASLEETA